MNMDNLLSVIMSNLAPHFKTQTGLTAQLSLTDFMPQGIDIKTGQTLLLNLDGDGNIQLIDNSGQEITIPQHNLNLEKNVNLSEPMTIQAKVGQIKNDNIRLQITEMNGQDPTNYLRSLQTSSSSQIQETVVTTKFSNPQNIPLQTIKVAELAQPFVQELPITQPQQTQIQTALQQIEIKVQINQMNFETPQTIVPDMNETSPVLQTITQTIKQLPSELVRQPQNTEQIIQEAVNQIADNLHPLIGTKIPATTQENNFASELGIIQPEIPLEFPEAITAELEITDIVQIKPIQQEKASPLDKILNIIEQLKIDTPELYQKISSKLPSDNEQMLSNMVAFTKASAKGDVRQWLGMEIVQQLEQQGNKGQAVINDLQNVLQGSQRQSPMWRIVEIPYYIENHIEKIKLAVKQYPDDEEEEENPHQKFGTRFVVDTNFTQLGAFQFDGFSFAKDRRFDLIIRTEREIEDDLCMHIMRLFKTTLNDVQYTGNIKINLKENFIKISENSNDDKFLAQGLYI